MSVLIKWKCVSDVIGQHSACSGHNAVNMADSKKSHGLATTGVGTVGCARHNLKLPCGTGDLQKGEKYVVLVLSSYLKTDSSCQDMLIWISFSFPLCVTISFRHWSYLMTSHVSGAKTSGSGWSNYLATTTLRANKCPSCFSFQSFTSQHTYPVVKSPIHSTSLHMLGALMVRRLNVAGQISIQQHLVWRKWDREHNEILSMTTHQEIEDSKIILYNPGWWFDKGLTCEV